MSRRKKASPAAAVELTQRALNDLREIERYSVQEWGRKTADKYLEDLATVLDRIQQNPGILRLEPDFAPGLYFYRVRKHVLACDYRNQRVIVLAVIHTSMDLPARLLELEPRLVTEAEMLRSQLGRQTKFD